jgi:type II secretory pathway pseudopilin PulG
MSLSKAREKTLEVRARKESRVRIVMIAVCVALLGVAAWGWWEYESERAGFRQAARQGESALEQVRSFRSAGQDHVPQGSALNFRTDPPTSGAHYSRPTDPGFYDSVQNPGNLVHALEHGIVVVYYDRPGDDVMRILQEWAAQFTNPWAGMIVAPKPGIGREVILTAWTKMLRLERFDEAAAAAFIDKYRGRGPEKPVR